MKKALLFLFFLIFLTGCAQKNVNLPKIRISGKSYPQNGTLIYSILNDNGAEKGTETIRFQTENNVICMHSDVRVTTVCLNKDNFAPVSETARFIVNNAPSDVQIEFFDKRIKVTIERGGKKRNFYLPKENPLYPDDALDFVLQGMDFSQSDAYLYDYFPYTSLQYVCEIKNLGTEKISVNKKSVETYHIVVDFGKKKRNLYFTVKAPHILVKRIEQNVTFILKDAKF